MDTAHKLENALEFIAKSRAELQSGKVVVLEGFQNDVKKICADIAELPIDDMQLFTPKLAELSENLQVLEKELRDQQTIVQQELFKLNRKQNALKSYQTVSHSTKDNKDSE